MRTFDEKIFNDYGLTSEWKQENQSFSQKQGLIRGLHFQLPPYTETKLVRVTLGSIWDVFVDLRIDSKTYGQWDKIELASDNFKMIYIPKGFAHGFCTLTDMALVQYKVDAYYNLQYEGGIRWDDETLQIPWPAKMPFLSDKDRELPSFNSFISPFVVAPQISSAS